MPRCKTCPATGDGSLPATIFQLAPCFAPREQRRPEFFLAAAFAPSFFSHDGSLLALSDQGETGGANYETLLTKTDNPSFVRLGEGYATSISPDNRWVAAIVPTTPQKLMLYPTEMGKPRRVDHGQIEAYDYADWFADGNHLLVSGHEPGAEDSTQFAKAAARHARFRRSPPMTM